jgi:lipoate-protein ligase B
VYADGANMNAILGIADMAVMGVDILHLNLHKTFSTPHGGGGPGAGPVCVTTELAQYLPVPRVVRENDRFLLKEDFPHSVGKLHAFYGNFGILARAYSYILSMGAENLAQVSRLAVLNANYIKAGLKGRYHLPYESPCMHECVFTDNLQAAHKVTALDIAKRLIDHGFHPPTIYFPLVVSGALMIEPTETETKETLDRFIAAMLAIATEAETDPDMVRRAPHHAKIKRLDEVRRTQAMFEGIGGLLISPAYLLELPLTDYDDALRLQHAAVQARKDGRLDRDLVMLLEHPPVFTLGRRGGKENLLVSEQWLGEKGIRIVPIERGGDITYHGPGQLVAYPIVDLNHASFKVVDFVEALENAMIHTAAQWGVDARGDPMQRGAWVQQRKLGSVGITVRRGISFHGLALNVRYRPLRPFRMDQSLWHSSLRNDIAEQGNEGQRWTCRQCAAGWSITWALYLIWIVRPSSRRNLKKCCVDHISKTCACASQSINLAGQDREPLSKDQR